MFAGFCFGMLAQIFIWATHFVTQTLKAVPKIFRPSLAGFFLAALFYWEGTNRFTGLGLEEIQLALRAPIELLEPFYKLGFTALSVGSGFKGGEFIPLVFIGTTAGNLLAQITPYSLSFMGALGFAATFGGAANTPIACTVMAMELFGVKIGPYALLACLMAFYTSSHQGIYHGQKIYARKHDHLKGIVGLKWLTDRFSRR
jgi:H+/Cl- antiporter ClcA